ncbi:MAG TPA: DUF971 domain-containing protein [Aestuariivirgaceae bacterium]|jgi:DUF971 family protein|nr:DUF971 domain-containing protein [Aestuariivirgaceae bacterium]
MTTEPAAPWPEEIRLKPGGRAIAIAFDDGTRFELTAEFLRVESPSAEVKGHGPGQEITVTGKEGVRIIRLDPVGNYAIRIVFDDGHSTGLYSWAYLHQLGCDHDPLWQDYLRRAGRA